MAGCMLFAACTCEVVGTTLLLQTIWLLALEQEDSEYLS